MSTEDRLTRAERIIDKLLEKRKIDKRIDILRETRANHYATLALLNEILRKSRELES